jgi:integrase
MPMAKSTKTTTETKPAKPYADFPLFPHDSGRWAKKILGKLHYFGYWRGPKAGTWEDALNLYQGQRDDLHAGRTPRNNTDGLTVRDLCNRFLTHKRHLLDNGELSERTFRDYHRTCELLVTGFGKNRLVLDLRASDFADYRTVLSKTRNPVSLGNEINRIRGVFKFAYDAELVENPIRFGPGFARPSKKTLRLHRQKDQQRNGKRMFAADELRKIIDAASEPLKAMVLLAINAGLGQSDLSSMPLSALDLKRGWLDYPRPKTGVERRCPLWPETVEALREVIDSRPEPTNAEDANLVFLTTRGNRWVKYTETGNDDAIAKEFAKLLTRLQLKRERVNFYAIRHTFQTVGGEAKDPEAVSHIMGHVDSSMAGLYGEGISDARLQAVVKTVHEWLWKNHEENV